MVAGSKAQEDRDGGRLSAEREMPVMMENKKGKYRHSLLEGKSVPTAVA